MMRKYQKHQIQDVVISLYDMHQEIIRKLNGKDYQVVQQYLNECQEAAIQVGEAIEQIVGLGTEAVACLEKYCEMLYQVNMQMESILPQEAEKQLKEALDRVDYSIRNIPVRQEAVFLPYKVSMWDSMESVFMAADADPNCDAYVIPIPYYDKNPDGSFKKEHYEGDQFPDYISVTDYRNYDFETHMPDMIYIHNPYDDDNYVTSVHPFFYSNSLKKYTSKLIYIPYYVCSENTRAENCTHIGVQNADVVVLQSDKIKNEYIESFRNVFGDSVSENKFVALGSPKFDKVIHSADLHNSLTTQWKRRADGRKIILYNTHLSSFLKYKEAAVKKIESVFDHFKQRDDVLLLWRPHPLSKDTLKVMTPSLYEAYIALEKRYLEEDIGIFDESSEVYSAISVADGYYGDSSSVLSLFGVTGKPICIQNVLSTNYDGYDRLRFEGVCANNTDLYFAASDFNMLVMFDKSTGRVKKISHFPGYGLNRGKITANIGIWKEKLWMLPFCGKKAVSFDLALQSPDVIELPEKWMDHDMRSMIFAGKQIGRYYYGFGRRQYGILKFDMETGRAAFCRDNRKLYQQMAATDKMIICRQDCCQVDRKLYAACLKGNMVFEYDADREKIDIYSVGQKDDRYVTIAYDGNAFWLTTTGGRLIRWVKETGDVQEIPISVGGYHVDGGFAFASSAYMGGYIWLFASSANMNIRINISTWEAEKTYDFKEPYNRENPVRVLKSWHENGEIYFVDAYDYSLVKIDREKGVSKFALLIDERFKRENWRAEDEDHYLDYIHKETKEPSKNLRSYLDYIVGKESNVDEKQKKCFLRFTKYPEGNSGEMIHKKMMEEE